MPRGKKVEINGQQIEVKPLTLDESFALMKEKVRRGEPQILAAVIAAVAALAEKARTAAKGADLIPDLAKIIEMAEKGAEVSVMALVPWSGRAFILSEQHLEAGLRVVKGALREHPELAEHAGSLDLETAAEIAQVALTLSGFVNPAEAKAEGKPSGETKSP